MEQKPLEAIAERFWWKSGKVYSNYCSFHYVSFKWLLKDANWETSIETRPNQCRCPLSKISSCPLKVWRRGIKLQTANKQMFGFYQKKSGKLDFNEQNSWCACICERYYLEGALHFVGTRPELQSLESLRVSAPRPVTSRGAARAAGASLRWKCNKRAEINPICCKEVRVAFQKHCRAASCFSTWLFVSAPGNRNQGISESTGDWNW